MLELFAVIAALLSGGSVFAGTDEDDEYIGTNQADIAVGGDGDDSLHGRRGNDILLGMDGDDELRGDRGNDFIAGGDGDDLIGGGRGFDVLSGGDGNDQLYGFLGGDELDGGAGDDVLNGGNWEDVLEGGTGQDVLIGGNADDVIRDESVVGTSASVGGVQTLGVTQTLEGNVLEVPFDAFVDDETGRVDTLVGDFEFFEVASGGHGDDDIAIAANNAAAEGGTGNDTLSVSGDVVFANGNAGNDDITIFAHNGQALGGDGDDILRLVGNDPFDQGGPSIIAANGGAGHDIIVAPEVNGEVARVIGGGGAGNDILINSEAFFASTGPGADTFFVSEKETVHATFQFAPVEDYIVLNWSDAAAAAGVSKDSLSIDALQVSESVFDVGQNGFFFKTTVRIGGEFQIGFEYLQESEVNLSNFLFADVSFDDDGNPVVEMADINRTEWTQNTGWDVVDGTLVRASV